MTNESNASSYAGILLAFLGGAAVGAAVVALTTRKTGPERLVELKMLADMAQAKATALAQGASDAWDTAKERTALASNDIKRGFSEAATDLRG